MATSSYTFKVTLSGADAIAQAKQVRKAIQEQLGAATLDVSQLPVALQALKDLKLEARGIGRALTAGFRAETGKLLQQIGELQTEVNQVVRAGASPVQEALEELGGLGLEAAGLIDAGSKEATQAMSKLTQAIQMGRAEMKELQEAAAKLATYPIVPTGAAGEVSNLGKLFHDMTHQRIKDVRRLARESDKELGPVREEIRKQAEIVRAEATPAFEKLKQEMIELQAGQRALMEQRKGVSEWSDEYKSLTAEIELYAEATRQAEKEAIQLRSAAMGTAPSEELTKVIIQEKKHMSQLQQKTIWWEELVQGGGDYAAIIDYIGKTSGKEAAEQLAKMVAHHERIKQLSTAEARAIGRMEKLQTKVMLPKGAEGSLALLVVAERDLGTSTEIAAKHLDAQAKALRKLTRELDLAAQAAQGLDRTQREGIKRLQMVTEKQIRGATRISLGLTPEEAGAAISPLLAQLDVQIEAIKRRTVQQISEIEQEGQRKKPFSWLVRAAEQVRRRLVGESIIPELVTSINDWLLRIGIQDPFTKLANDANDAAQTIQSGLETRLKALSTAEARQELKRLQESIEETGISIEKQLVRTGQAGQAYKRAFAQQAAEVTRVRGDDPAVMGMLARGQLPKGVGIRGEFKTMEIIDEGYQALRVEVEERQRLTAEETEKLLELERKHTTMRLQALALDRELASRQVTSLERAMAAALDEDQDVEAFEALNKKYIVAQERLGDVSEDIVFQREMITSRVAAELEKELQESKSMARRTITPAAGAQVGGKVIMPRITKTQVKNARDYAKAMAEVGAALKGVPTKQYQEALLAVQKMLTEMKEAAPAITAEEQKRLIATARSIAHASESQRRLTEEFKAEEARKTQIHGAAVDIRKMAVEKSADVVVELAKRRSQVEKQEARGKATEVIEGERRLTASLKEEERRRTLDHQEQLRQRAREERALRKERMQPTAADISQYGGGQMGALAWTAFEAQRRQMGLRSLTYDMRNFGRTAMIASAALTGPPVLAMKRFVDYTRQTNQTARSMGLAREESEYLRQALIDQSVALGMVKPEEMAAGFHLWVSAVGAGATSAEELESIIADTIPIQQLAYMQQIGLTEAVEATAGILAEYRLESSETDRVVAVLGSTADRTLAQVSDLGEAFKFVGPIAEALGVSVEETAATFGLLSDANIRGSMAGRAMRQMMVRLTKSTEKEDEALDKVFNRSKAMGESWRDLVFPEGKFIGLARWVDLLAAATEKMADEERAALLATIATANELPAMTALVTRQIEAREAGVNIIRAEAKILDGVLDAEVQAYAKWDESITGNIMSLESAQDSFVRQTKATTEEEAFLIDQMAKKWDAAMLSLGQSTMKLAMPALGELSEIVGDLAEFMAANPWVAKAMLAAGGVVGAVAVLATTAATVMRAITIARTISTAIQGWSAAQHILAADTQIVAANTQMAAAEVQAGSNTKFLTGLGRVLGLTVAGIGGFEIGRRVSEKVRGEEIGPGQALEEIWTYLRQASTLAIAGEAMIRSLARGGDPVEAFENATLRVGEFLGLVEETTDELGEWPDELEKATRMGRDFSKTVADTADELMQISATGGGLFAFTEAELEAIDELEGYLRRRNEMVEKHNDDLAKMERDFLDKEEEHYKDYLDKKADLEEELRQVAQDPLWQMAKDVKKSEKRIAKAIEDYNKRISNAIRDHQRKLRNLQEGHDDKMEGLEASRDARGILSERRSYSRAVRDANEHHTDLLESAQERLDDTIETEREKIETMRQERVEDLEEKLRELDENYQKEQSKRKEAYDKAYVDRAQAQAKELTQLAQAHAERLGKIMGWEAELRLELQRQYLTRQGDLARHLNQMRAQYAAYYGVTSQTVMSPEEVRQEHERIRGHQLGGYASTGVYRLGEAGDEFVLSAPTTRALERAIGHLSQSRILGMAGGAGGGHFKLDVRVTADDHFSPAFAAQTEAIVRREIVGLSTQAASSRPGAYRPH